MVQSLLYDDGSIDASIKKCYIYDFTKISIQSTLHLELNTGYNR